MFLSDGLSKIFNIVELKLSHGAVLQAFIVISSSWRRECEAVEDSRDRSAEDGCICLGNRTCRWQGALGLNGSEYI